MQCLTLFKHCITSENTLQCFTPATTNGVLIIIKKSPNKSCDLDPFPTLLLKSFDYCNSLLNNIVKRDLAKLQRIKNCLARVVLRAPRFSPSLPLHIQLHRLPDSYRIHFKLSTLTHRALSTQQPPYLASLLHLSNIPRQLRSSISK